MNPVFNAYARYYDLLYRDKSYVAEAEYIVSHIRAHAPLAKRILDLGCGTGAHAIQLAQMGYTVHGVDMSEEMLARAEERRAELPAAVATRLSFGSGDVRSVRTEQCYDIVTSLFHVMSYLPTDADLVAAFDTVAAHLLPGGLLLFDFWYGPAVLTQKPEVRVKKLEDEEIKVMRIAEPAMHVNENLVDVNYTVFIEERATGQIEQVSETHRMKYLFFPELYRLLLEAGFGVLGQYQWMETKVPDENSWAAFVIARKL